MKRADSKKEFIEAVFTGNEENKNLAFEVDSNGAFIVLNRKSGIYDKPCAPKQEINLKKIIEHSLTDTNVKFKRLMGTKPNSYSNWKITKEQILDNALCYLSNKGVTINNPYRNETDKRHFKKLISTILTEHIVPAIYTCKDEAEMSDDDDISEYFDKAIKKLKKIYTNDNMDDLIYESAKKDDYEAFGISTANYHYRVSFNQYK